MLVVGSTKGGVGKTTLTTNLGVMRALSGRSILLVDSDAQGTLTHWVTQRNNLAVTPQIDHLQLRGKALHEDLQRLSQHYDDILMDTAGDSVELRAAMVSVQKMCIPLRASQFDIWTLESLHDLVLGARKINSGLRAMVVLNAVPTTSDEAHEALELLQQFEGFQISQTIIHDRVAFREAGTQGRSVLELGKRAAKSIAEIKDLYRDLYGEAYDEQDGKIAGQAS